MNIVTGQIKSEINLQSHMFFQHSLQPLCSVISTVECWPIVLFSIETIVSFVIVTFRVSIFKKIVANAPPAATVRDLLVVTFLYLHRLKVW